MGIQERERKMHGPLRRAGLEVIPDAVPDGTMPWVGGYDISDVVGGFSHPYATPRLVERLNEDWYDLAVSVGLLDERREFLVLLPEVIRTHRSNASEPRAWTRVRLLDDWDIMGRGAASAFLGVRAGHPGFDMLALDSSVYVRCSTGEAGVDVLAVGHPHRSEHVVQHLERYATWEGAVTPYDREMRRRVATWLATRA
ncbi:hypothetical protein [Streptomyces roseicoloratus]|uniref:DUF5753 domain-containing protein n=1 Tax=Streptomyces roseicoloratus TaxID=2508722 RepID=A0ABY9S2M8_9ACTN|nr:hypothetical protein [Streptomyces roseicoloratus]WMX47310.1 hypothetical protein RGF97_24235 [Streptomyces roseicoloratus]